VHGTNLHRASFGLFPRADACQINGQAVTPDRRSPLKIHSQGGKEKMKPFMPFFHDTL
jgi:hypothetical protein